MTILEVAEALRTATRQGADQDIPEGSRFIELSETLANEMIKAIEEQRHG